MRLEPTGMPFDHLGQRFEVDNDSNQLASAVYAPVLEPNTRAWRSVILGFAFLGGLLIGAWIGPAAAAVSVSANDSRQPPLKTEFAASESRP